MGSIIRQACDIDGPAAAATDTGSGSTVRQACDIDGPAAAGSSVGGVAVDGPTYASVIVVGVGGGLDG